MNANPAPSSTMSFGFNSVALSRLMGMVLTGDITKIGRDKDLAAEIGIGAVQVEALGAWARFCGLIGREEKTLCLTELGESIYELDPQLIDPVTWWILHWQLSQNYVAWEALTRLAYGAHEVTAIEAKLSEVVPDASARTYRNARLAVILALRQTPLGNDLGLVRLEYSGNKVIRFEKCQVRHPNAPIAGITYGILAWVRRHGASGASLDELLADGAPGAALQLTAGELERYLMDIHTSFAGRVLTYSRTAGLDQAYFREDVTARAVYVAHFVRRAEGLSWPDALAKALAEVGCNGGR